MGDVKVWNHTRKGRIVGRVVWEDDEWMDIQLAGDQNLRWLSISNRLEPPVEFDGDVLRVRKSLCPEEAQ
jgi:hypothetical protein